MIFELARVRKFSDDQERQECFCFKSIGLIVAPWKFEILKTTIFSLVAYVTAGISRAFVLEAKWIGD